MPTPGKLRFVSMKLFLSCICLSSIHVMDACAARRVFVFANQNYAKPAMDDNGVASINDLPKSERNASAIAKKLKGAEKIDSFDDAREQVVKKWQRFIESVQPGDEAIVYYTGHGAQVGGHNYLVPILSHAQVSKLGNPAHADELLLSVSDMVKDLRSRKPGVSIWILDACRNDIKSIDPIDPSIALPAGTFMWFSAGAGEQAWFWPEDYYSVFTGQVLAAIEAHPKLPIHLLAKIVQRGTRGVSSAKRLKYPYAKVQSPAFYDGLALPWCFKTCEPGQLLQLTHTKSDRSVSKLTVRDFVNAVAGDDRNQNAVFLGRDSFLANCNDGENGPPFGCRVLNEVSLGNARQFIGKAIKVATPLNLRWRAPVPTNTGSRKYFCRIETLEVDASVILSGVIELVYEGDVFYWGTTGTDRECPKNGSQT